MVVSVSELFALTGSLTAEDTDAVFVIVVPLGVAGFTFTTIENAAVASSANEATAQLTDPVPPAEGIAHPAEGETETNVVFAGVASVRTTLVAVSGPSLSMTIVYVMFEPAVTGSGESVFVTERSAGSSTATAGIAGSRSKPPATSPIKARRVDEVTSHHSLSSPGRFPCYTREAPRTTPRRGKHRRSSACGTGSRCSSGVETGFRPALLAALLADRRDPFEVAADDVHLGDLLGDLVEEGGGIAAVVLVARLEGMVDEFIVHGWSVSMSSRVPRSPRGIDWSP